jgi:PAS domain S-box-containing protein
MSLTSDKKCNILIVDDVPKNIQIAANILGRAGYQIAFAGDGKRALNYIGNKKPDLILLDIMMPEMDGFEVCQILKADPETAGIPIIFLTAKTETENIVRGFQLGAVDYITKPFNADELQARVKTHLTISRLQQQLTAQNEQLQSEIAEHRKTAAALKEREELFRGMFENHSAVMLLINPETGLIIHANKAASDYYGYSSEELSGMAVTQINTSSDLSKLMQSVKEEKQNYFRFQHRLADGQLRDVEVYSTPIIFQGHTLLFSVIHDITDRRLAEKALRDSEEQYRDLVQNANNVILRATPQWEITFFNSYAQKFFGYTEEEILGKSVFGTIVPDAESLTGRDLNIILNDIAKHPDKYRYNENENMRKNGERVWLAWTNKVVTDSEGNPKEILCIANDITEKKQAEKALLESEEKYRNLVENLSDALFMTDAKGTVFYISPIIEAIVGLKPEEIVGRHLSEFFHPEDLPFILEKFKKIISGQNTEPSEVRVFHKSGKTIWIRTSSRVHIRNGVILGLQGLITDITARKQAEEALKRSNSVLKAQQESSIDGILVIDEHRKVVSNNRRFMQLWNISDDLMRTSDSKKLVEYVLSRLKHPHEFFERLQYLYEHKSESSQDEVELTDGRILDRHSSPIITSGNQYIGRIWFFRDISERKLAEKKLGSANKAIMDSIRYAELIQKSILPNINEVKIAMPDSFFIWLPRDIVGGDIFFVHSFDNGFVFAVIDCTGHGIPGAFMSMIAFSALKRIVSDGNCNNPGEILKRMNKIVKTSLRQDTAYALSDDGLDAAVCFVKFQNPPESPFTKGEQRGILTFAGAKMPLYCVRKGESLIIRGDKQSIGYKRSDLNFDFGNHTIPIKKGTVFYMATDGFGDQLDGNDRRFGSRRLRNLLKEIAHLPFEKQREILLEAFETHKGNRQRQDDVTVAGFGF